MNDQRQNKLPQIFIASLVLVFNSLAAFAQQAITTTNATNVTVAAGTTYNANGATGSGLAGTNFDYRYGNLSGTLNNKVYLNHFAAGGTSYVFEYSPVVTVVLNRVNNAAVTGPRDLVFNEGAINTVPAPDQININAPYVPLMTTLLPGNDDLRSGTDNLFGNAGDGSGNNNNVERIDVRINGTTGYDVIKPERQGFAVFERGAAGAHDAFTVSVITSIDGLGNPNGYTGLIRIVSAGYGATNPVGNANYVILRRDGGVGNLLASATLAAQGIGGIFFEFDDFGIAPNTTIYGYSIAAADFPIAATAADMVDFTSATNFPTTTPSGGAGGIDLTAITGVFRIFDDDFDGLSANLDVDDDNDGITDLAENGGTDGFADADTDGLPNFFDPSFAGFTDSNLDGINDNFDVDLDGVINQIDLDSDNDAIPDIVEAGGVDTNGDGRIDGAFADSDGDGLHNTYDASTGGDALPNRDSDGDGVANSKDLDSDNDGIPDVTEAFGLDFTNDGQIDFYFDSDGDGLTNDQDGDTDNDGTAENTIGALIPTGADVNSDGQADSYVRADQDADGVANPYDLDSDRDGILDVREAGFADSNNDGYADGTLGGDGWSDIIDNIDPLILTNTDGFGKPNYLDIDADDDGIVDIIEGQTTAGYIAPSGADSDKDGIDNAYDNNDAVFGGSANNGIAPNNQESNGNPDYIDTDTDNDGIADVIEGWDTNGNGIIDGAEIAFVGTTDADDDGLLNEYDVDDANPEPTNGTTPASYPDIDITTTQRAWREPVDNDEDGVVDGTDVDDDNDGIPDALENPGGVDPFADADGDGAPNFIDPTPGPGVPAFVDANGDNINDAFDADRDGVINIQDLDSDNDGIADIAEAGGVDTNGDGRVDGLFSDTDADGLHNTYDASTGGNAIANRDTDGDGITNYQDLDSDNDGIPDVVEAFGADGNNNGIIDFYFDSDGDGFSNDVDGDSDNDGTAENAAAALIRTGTDGNSDGIPDTYPFANQDANGLPDPYDLDSDGDGILDVREAGLPDSNNDGVADGTVGADGWSDTVDALPTLTLPDTDAFATGKPNYLDIDSDDDGIVDNIEGQSTSGYVAPAGADSDGDGIDNAYDNNDAAFAGGTGNGITPNNQENDANPDYVDPDSDNDGSLDEIEGWDTNVNGLIDGAEIAFVGTTDTDGDGLFNEYDADDLNPEPTNGTTPASYPDADLGTTERKWREPVDNDADGVVNSTDVDDDNDGIPDALENPGGVDPSADADGDGTPNFLDPTPGPGAPAYVDSNGDNINDAYDTDVDGVMDLFDLDSDNDGIADLAEAGGVDTDGDGRVDGAFADSDADGLHNTYDASSGGDAIANRDTDGDGVVNSKDLDSDNDGIPDVVEAGGTDANNDGKIDGFTDTDNDGFAQSADGDTNNDGTADNTAGALLITGTDGNSDGQPDTYPRANADANGLPNPYDLDADGDGILDVREAGIADATNDGVADGVLGSDGWSDAVDALGSLNPANTDGFGRANYLDIDADDDGIVDIIEGQSTAGYTAPAGTDGDNDGIDDAYDNNDAAFAGGANNGITPVADSDDGETVPDYTDLDTDGDGKTDRLEGWDTNGNAVIDGAEIAYVGTTDADNDGLLNEYDADDVNPEPTNGTTPASYPDVNNPGDDRDWRQSGDADNDGVLDIVDTDDDNDGIPDATEGSGDTDGDGRPDSRDLDSDNDGIADLSEAGGVDSNGDGRIDGAFADTDGDGLHNTYDASTGGDAIANRDTDGDGVANAYDKDSDGDGIPDVVEALGSDGNNDGVIDFYFDSDGDGFSNDVDGDSDNDGTAENAAAALIITGADTDSDGQPNSYPRANTDKLGLPNPYDLDADGDGILDAREAGFADATNDGIADGTLGADGWSDTVDGLASLNLPNSDLAGPADYLDIDADDDGLTDNVEGQSTAGYQLPSGVDADGDGIDDLYDNNDAAFAGGANNGITPYNHDGADTPDYTDINSDNDSVNDLREGSGDPNATLTNVADTDGDGLVDQFDILDLVTATTDIQNNVTNAGMGNGGSAVGPTPAGSNLLAPQTPGAAPNRDWRNNAFVLPVRFIEIRLTVTTTSNIVAWTVADELNVKEYIVERSVDGVNFVAAGTVAYRDNGGGQQTYSFNDAPTLGSNGTVYYRIRQVDIDGRFMISKVVFYKAGQNKTGLTVLRNPVVNNEIMLNISAERQGSAELQLLNIKGRVLLVQKQSISNGNTTMRLAGSGGYFANGIYFVKAIINGQLFVEKIIINK
jgi:hypothetical protein